MKTLSSIFLLLILSIGANARSAMDTGKVSSFKTFSKKIEDAKMVFVKPEETTEVPIYENTGIHYDYALQVKGKNIEIRYIVWPLTKNFFDSYDRREKKLGDTVLNPNKLHNSIPAILFSKISDGRLAPEQVRLQKFSHGAVKGDSNADEGVMFMGPVGSAFGQSYKFGYFEMLHKDYAGDIYILYLFENQDALFKEAMSITANKAIYLAVKFKQ